MADYERGKRYRLWAQVYYKDTDTVVVLSNDNGSSLTLLPDTQQQIKESLLDG